MNTGKRVFIGSSTEAKGAMYALEASLDSRGHVARAWKGSFGLAQNTLGELWRLAHEVDYAVFVVAADSLVEEREKKFWAARDNVIYEAGLFAGVLSPSRVYWVVEAGRNVKIPSDYAGIAWATYTTPDSDGVRSAAIEIDEAIRREDRKLLAEDMTRNIEGVWVDAVVNRDEMSVISAFEIQRVGAQVLEIVNGRSWDATGEPRAKFASTSSKFDPTKNKLTYSWEGSHPREAGVSQHFGVGEISFERENSDRATGWFSSSPRAAPDATKLISRSCRKYADSEAEELFSDDRAIRQAAVARLLEWRDKIR